MAVLAAVLPDGTSMIHEKDLRKLATLKDPGTEQLGDYVGRFPSECRPAGPVFCDRGGT